MNVIQELAIRIKAILDYSKLKRDRKKLYKEFDEALKIPADIVVSKDSKNVIDNYIDQTNSSIKSNAGDAAGDISGAGKDFGAKVSKEAYTIAQILGEALQGIGNSLSQSADLILEAFAGNSDAMEALNESGYVTNGEDGYGVEINPYKWLQNPELVGLIGVIGNALGISAKALEKFKVSTESASKSLDKNTSKVSSKGIKDDGSAGRTILDQLMSGMGINPSVAVMAKAGTAIGILVGLIRRILQKNEALQQATEGFIQALSDLLSPVVKIVTWIINAFTKLINAFIKWLGIEVEATEEVASNTKSLAGFDTITNLNSGSTAGSSGGNNEPVNNDDGNVSVYEKFRIPLKQTLTQMNGDIVEWCNNAERGFGTVTTITHTAYGDIEQTVSATLGTMVDLTDDKYKSVSQLQEKYLNEIQSTNKNKWNGVKVDVSKTVNDIQNSVNGLDTNSISTEINDAQSSIDGLNTDNITTQTNSFANRISTLWNNILAGLGVKGYSIKSFDVGTNYITHDQIAMVHKGEAIVPKKFNSGEFFGGNADVVSKLDQLIGVVDSKEFKAYISKNDVGKAAVSYIHTQNRILGGSLV